MPKDAKKSSLPTFDFGKAPTFSNNNQAAPVQNPTHTESISDSEFDAVLEELAKDPEEETSKLIEETRETTEEAVGFEDAVTSELPKNAIFKDLQSTKDPKDAIFDDEITTEFSIKNKKD